jgi:hypothetical protein
VRWRPRHQKSKKQGDGNLFREDGEGGKCILREERQECADRPKKSPESGEVGAIKNAVSCLKDVEAQCPVTHWQQLC